MPEQRISKEELISLITSKVEESVGVVTDVQVKAIEAAVEKKFFEMSKTPEGKKAFGGEGSQEIDETIQFKSFGDQLMAVYKAAVPGNIADVRLKAASGLNEGTASDGGFIVQPTFANELYTGAHQESVLYKKCRKIPIGANSNTLVLNAIDERSRVNGSRWGGVQVYWSDEAGTATATKPQFRQMTLKLKKLMGTAYVTEELMQDSTALQAVITQAFKEEFAYRLDDGIVSGNGVGQLFGVLNSTALVTQAKEAGQAADTVVFENIVKMWNRMPANIRQKAEWYINQDVEPELMQMFIAAGTGGFPVFLPPGGITQAPNGTLLGKPVNPIEQCQELGNLGDILFMALQEYLLIDKGDMTASESIHVRFLYDEQTFKFTYRVDGQPLWNNPLISANGGTTRSPFVGLQSR